MLAVQQREEKDMKIIQFYHVDTIHNTQIIDDEMLSNPFGNVLVSLFSAFEVLTIWTAALTRIPIALVQQRTSHVSRRRNHRPGHGISKDLLYLVFFQWKYNTMVGLASAKHARQC